MNNYFFPEKNIKFFSFLYKNDHNFVFKENFQIKEVFKNKTFINEDLYNQQDHSEICIKSFKIAKKIKLSNYFSKNKLLNEVLKKKLVINIEEILRISFLFEKIKTHYSLKNLYLCKLFYDLELFYYLKKKNYISKEIKISKTYLYASKFLSSCVNIYLLLNLIFLPEKIFFLCRKNSNKKKYFAVFNFDTLPNFNDNNGYMSLLNKINKPSIFIKELKMNESFFYKKDYNRNLQNVLFISDVFKNISLLSYFLNFYKKYFFERLKLIFSFNQNYKEKYRYFSNKICWEVFFHCFQVKKCLTAMQPCDLTSQIIQKKNSKETIFFYLSSTYCCLKNENDNDYVSHIQYNQMNYSSLITNEVSTNFLNKKSNNFDNFLKFKPATISLNSNSKRNILLFRRKFNLENKKIIAIFDNSFGYKGILTNNEYINFLKYLNFLIKKYKNYFFILKKKKRTVFFSSNIYNSKELNSELNKMKNFKNFINFNDKLTTSEVIYLSDIILTNPNSSIINESFSLKKTTAIFDNIKINFSDKLYSKINNKININNIKYRNRLLDKDILNLLKMNSKKIININKDKNVSDLINYLND